MARKSTVNLSKSELEELQHPGNRESDYDKLTGDEKLVLQQWITSMFEHSKTTGPRPVRGSLGQQLGFGIPTSYGLKHWFEDFYKGFYVTNGQFKGAMLAAGFRPTEKTKDGLNWKFRIKLKKLPRFEQLCRFEPRLRELQERAAAICDDPREHSFCANWHWYGPSGLEADLCRLIGWEAERTELQSSRDYDIAYREIYSQLPSCRNCACP